jgi:DUF177 domain-containing protein
MRLELKDIKGGDLEQDYSCTFADFPELKTMSDHGGPVFVEPFSFHLRFQRTGQLVELEGQVTADILLSCGRCLKEFRLPVAESFALTFSPVPQKDVDDEEVELDADELGLITYQDETLDLAAPLLEQLVMAVPISPVCSDECHGLCAECGLDLNDSRCLCEKKVFNNKFSVLARIKLDS